MNSPDSLRVSIQSMAHSTLMDSQKEGPFPFDDADIFSIWHNYTIW